MSDKKQYQSTKEALQRRIQCYPPPRYHGLTKAFAKANEMSEGKVINLALKCFFDQMPESDRQRIVTVSKNHY